MSRTIRRKRIEREGPRGGPTHGAIVTYLSDYILTHHPDQTDDCRRFWYWYVAHGESRSSSERGMNAWQRKTVMKKYRSKEKAKLHRYITGLSCDVVVEKLPKHPPWTW